MTATEKTNDELALEAFNSHMQDLEEYQKKLSSDNDEELEAVNTELFKSILSIDKKAVIHVCLYTGGPGGGYKIWVDSEGCLGDVYFYHSEWFHYKEYRLSDDEKQSFIAAYGDILECNGVKY